MSRNSIKTVLLIEDNAGDARLLREMLSEEHAHDSSLTRVATLREAQEHLVSRTADVILLDLGLPDAQALEALRGVRIAAPRAPIVVLTGLDDEALAARALQDGAQDYLIKGQIEARSLWRAIRYAIERKIMEEALFVEKERAQVTLKSIGDAVICTDELHNVTFLNCAAERMTGWSGNEATGKTMADVFQVIDATSREATPIAVEKPGDEWELAVRGASNSVLVRRDGTEVQIEESASPIHDRDGRVTGAVVVLRDVGAARAMAQQLTHSAEHDFLTGLPNRMLLKDRIGRAIASAPRRKRHVAVMFLDLDGFKHINDTLGHLVGDRLLQSVAQRLVECVRGSDTVCRQGGDEFVVLLSELEQPEDAAITARRMLKAVAEPHSIDGRDIHITTSIGVSSYPEDGLDAETLIKHADIAMYQSKEGGRQRFKFFKPAMNAQVVDRQFIEEGLRRAIDRNEFALHYQPIINLRTGAITGAEALIRWDHPARGQIAPANFIPIAETCGLILPIGAWILRAACTQAQIWAEAGLKRTTMAVNVSAVEFQDENFLEGLFAILKETRLDPTLLELELTESVLMKRAESAAATLHALREKGVRVAIDDFGTGYSSLSYLRKFPVDLLKIDQSFVRHISTAGEDTAIVSAVISMARSLNLKVIAEGIETFDELLFLRTRQCDEGQGFYFSRPVPAEDFTALIEGGIPQDFAPFRALAPIGDKDRAHASP